MKGFDKSESGVWIIGMVRSGDLEWGWSWFGSSRPMTVEDPVGSGSWWIWIGKTANDWEAGVSEEQMISSAGCWCWSRDKFRVDKWKMCFCEGFEACLFWWIFDCWLRLIFQSSPGSYLEVRFWSEIPQEQIWFWIDWLDLLLTHLGGVCSWFSIDCFFLPS